MQTNPSSIFLKYIAIPQDHGSWVFIISPLMIGLFAGKSFSIETVVFVITAMLAFMIRQPVTILAKIMAGRRDRKDISIALAWILIYGSLLILAITFLLIRGQLQIIYLGLAAIPVFAWNIWLVSRKQERRQIFIEILGTGVLALAAPAAYWLGSKTMDSAGWILWVLVWIQSAASIVYAYARLEQRAWTKIPDWKSRLQTSRIAILFSAVNLFIVLGLGFFNVVSYFLWLPYFIQFFETILGTIYPAFGLKPVAIGLRQLMVSTLFTILFIITWR